jgi:hypothetical protein
VINPKYLCFERCEQLFATARNKDNGKPVPRVSGIRLFKNQDSVFTVRRYGALIATVTDTNVVTLYEQPLYFIHHAYQRLFGITSWRIGKRKSRVWSVETHGWNRGSDEMFKSHPMFFPGLEYDLNECKFLNTKPDPVRKRNPEADLAWRRKLSQYTKIWAVSAKCGAFDWVKELYKTEPFCLAQLGSDEVVSIVDKQDLSPETIKRIVIPICWSELRWNPQRVDQAIATAFKRTYASRREQIRKNLGCFAYE